MRTSLHRSLHRLAQRSLWEIASESQKEKEKKKEKKRATDRSAALVSVGLWLGASLTNSKIVRYLPREHATLGLGAGS